MDSVRSSGAIIDKWPPPSAGARAAWLAHVAAGAARVGRAAQQALAAEGWLGVRANLAVNVEGAVALALDDAALYGAAAAWDAEDRRGLWRALARYDVLAQRVVGYGQYLLGGSGGDPVAAWRPMGAWVLATARGWALLRRRMVLSLAQARDLAAIERRSAPWARRLNTLAYAAGVLAQGEAQTLLELAGSRGGPWLRLRARGALAQAQRWAEARLQDARDAARAATEPQYPDLIPIEHFADVPAATSAAPNRPKGDPA